MRGVQFIQSYLNGQQNDNNNQGEQVCSDGVQSIPRDVTTANLRLVKNVVGLQKFDQELRVSYKPTAFRRWVVDMREKVFTNGNS